MHDALHEHSHVRILELLDAHAAAVAVRKECVRLAGDLLDERVAVTAEERHERVRRFRTYTGDDSGGGRATQGLTRRAFAVRWVTAKNLP